MGWLLGIGLRQLNCGIPELLVMLGTFSQSEKVYNLSVSGDGLIVHTAGYRVLVWNLQNMSYVQQHWESCLEY